MTGKWPVPQYSFLVFGVLLSEKVPRCWKTRIRVYRLGLCTAIGTSLTGSAVDLKFSSFQVRLNPLKRDRESPRFEEN